MTNPNFRYTTRVYSYSATIAAGANESGIIDMIGVPLIGIQFPLTFKGDLCYIDISVDGTNFLKAHNPQGVRMGVRACPGCYICISPDDFRGIRYIRLVSSSIEDEEQSITVYGRGDG
jgi:hypothetical protein